MSNSIAQKFTFTSLMKFVFPTIIMMVFMSLYTIVDGIFVSRLLGSNSLSSLNIVYPVQSIILAIGIMLGTGGSAIIAKKLGEGKKEEANSDFSFISLFAILIGFLFLIICSIFLEPICRILGASDILLKDSMIYLQIALIFAPITMMQLLYQTFFVTAGHPTLGLICTIIGGISNMVLDFVFMGPMHMGIEGAAIATGIGQVIPVVVGGIFFFTNKKSLYYQKPKIDIPMLINSCSNGASEMVSNLSTAVVTFLFNIIMLDLMGENGVAAITIALYSQFLFHSLFLGFSMGVAPVFSFNYGSKNIKQIKHIYKICSRFILVSSIVMLFVSILSSKSLIAIFTPINEPTYQITVDGYYLFALNFLFTGVNIFASALFTAFSNGKVSAIISFLRTFVVIVACILILPKLIGVNGVWLAIPIAEFITLFISLYYLKKYKTFYHYG